MRAWFVVALVLSLAGDVFLLGDDRWFVPGLAAFLAGHLAYVIGFVLAEPWRWWSFALAWIGLVRPRGHARPAHRRGRRRTPPALRMPVTSYLGVISLMVAAAAAAGNTWAVAGAVAVLDVRHDPRMAAVRRPSGRGCRVTIMVTYHLAQAALVISLI